MAGPRGLVLVGRRHPGDAAVERCRLRCVGAGTGLPPRLYGPGPTLLDEFNIGQIVDRGLQDYKGDRSGARTMVEEDGQLHISWFVHRDGDFGAGPTLPVEVVLDVAESRFVVAEVLRKDEQSMLDEVIAAANTGDRAALGGYDLGPYVAEDLIAAVEAGGPFTGTECVGGTDNLDHDWVDSEASRSCELTQADGGRSWAYLLLDYEPDDPSWRLDTFDSPLLYGD